MTLRPALEEEMVAWQEWLQKSHGLKNLPGAPVYRCEIGYPLLLVRWRKFEGFNMRLDRETAQPIMSFRLHGRVRTIAGFWYNPRSIRMSFSRKMGLDFLRTRMIKAAAEGLIWWGIEYPPESRVTTSILVCFPKRFPFPPSVKSELVEEMLARPLVTSLNLV